MTQRIWKFMATATATMAAPVYNALIQAGDNFETAIAKLQSLLSIRALRAILISPVSGGTSSNADFTLLTLTIPANRLVAGDIFEFALQGTNNKTNALGSTVSYWVRVGATKVMTITFTPSGAINNQPFTFNGRLIVRSIGSAGTIACGGEMTSHTTATTVFRYAGTPGVATQNTTASFTITIGGTYSNINASNLMTAVLGAISQI